MNRLLDPHRLPGHLDRLQRAARAMCRNPHDAEDLVQETCVRLLARPRRIHAEDELGYVLRALRNTHINRHRATARRPRTAELADCFEVADPNTAERPDERAREAEVAGWIAALPQDLAAAITAIDVVGLSTPEAAVSLSVSESEVVHHLTRARISMAAKLEPASRAVTR